MFVPPHCSPVNMSFRWNHAPFSAGLLYIYIYLHVYTYSIGLLSVSREAKMFILTERKKWLSSSVVSANRQSVGCFGSDAVKVNR